MPSCPSGPWSFWTGWTGGRGGHKGRPYRSTGRPQHVGAPLVVARPAAHACRGGCPHPPAAVGIPAPAPRALTGTGGHKGRPYRNAGRPQHVGATLVVARPAGRTSVGADAHIRPLPRGSRTDTLGDRTETGGHKGRPYRNTGRPKRMGAPLVDVRPAAHARRGRCPHPPAAQGRSSMRRRPARRKPCRKQASRS